MPSSDLGLSCPVSGKFYVCSDAKIKFIGCCDIDPCKDKSGNCPAESLHSSSFSSDYYDSIPPQECVAPYVGAKNWYTCQASVPPYLGCCSSNPCDTGTGCPSSDVLAARLSDKPKNAEVFQNSSAATTTSATASSSAKATSQPSTNGSNTGGGLSTGATVGIVIGCVAVIVILGGILAYKCGWSARKRRDRDQEAKGSPMQNNQYPDPGSAGAPPAYPQYYDQNSSPSTGYSPNGVFDPRYGQPVPSPRSPQDMYKDHYASQMPPMANNSTAGYTPPPSGHYSHHFTSELDGSEIGRAELAQPDAVPETAGPAAPSETKEKPK